MCSRSLPFHCEATSEQGLPRVLQAKAGVGKAAKEHAVSGTPQKLDSLVKTHYPSAGKSAKLYTRPKPASPVFVPMVYGMKIYGMAGALRPQAPAGRGRKQKRFFSEKVSKLESTNSSLHLLPKGFDLAHPASDCPVSDVES